MSRRLNISRLRDRAIQDATLTPKTIFGSDLVSWHRADLGITVDGFNRVSNWVDQTGNGHNLSQSTAGSRPDYVASGGPGGGPYINSATYGTAYLQYGGTPVTINTGAWSGFIIMTAGTTAATRVVTTTLTTPAGCVAGAFRAVATSNDMDFQQLGLSAPTLITVTDPDMNPVNTWIGCGVSMRSDGTRMLAVLGDATQALTTDGPHSGSIGLQLAEGYVCARFGGTFYQNIKVQEIFWVKRTTSTMDLALVRNYMRLRGIST